MKRILNKNLHYNLSRSQLFDHEIKGGVGEIIKTKYGDVFGVKTGKFTGRSPNDKYIVLDETTKDSIWWGDVNKPISKEIFNNLKERAFSQFEKTDDVYLFDGYCGSNRQTQKHVRFVHEMAWQQHFVSNMFINTNDDLKTKDPDFTIINACSVVNDEWKKQNLNSDVAIVFDISQKLGIILGTWYGGENKKGIFSLMNYWLPDEGILPMHCAANVDRNGENACLFFGLSGTGKTSLSTDSNRYLIGDDEHGWDANGVFNFEGGCYAKTINLTEENEPDIYRAIRKDALLENIYTNENLSPDYTDVSITQNGRVSYPIDHIPNMHNPQVAGHPENIIFLTCDAFGVLPPVSRLNHEQAMYYFLSGYTSKVAGTERGVTEPEATFSPCFGGAFLTRHPKVYCELLKEKLEKHGSNVYLVNTGWFGGGYGEGQRLNIKTTRECVDNILNGNIEKGKFEKHSIFDLEFATEIGNIPTTITDPSKSWVNKDNYIHTAIKLRDMFEKNYETYA